MFLLSYLVATQLLTATPAAQKPDSAFTVTAKLIEIPAKFPPDDLYDYAFVVKYEVVGGARDKQALFVAHYKPRQARKKIKDKMSPYVQGNVRRFKVGDLHKLELRSDIKKIWTGALVDEYFATDRESPRFWCQRADNAK